MAILLHLQAILVIRRLQKPIQEDLVENQQIMSLLQKEQLKIGQLKGLLEKED